MIFVAIAVFILAFGVLYTLMELRDVIWYRITIMLIFSALVSMLVTSNLIKII